MSDYEWEGERIPRVRGVWEAGHRPSRRSSIGEFVALEFPRESAAWVVKSDVVRSTKRSPFARSRNEPPR